MTLGLVIAALCQTLGAAFEVQAIALGGPDAAVHLVPGIRTSAPDVCIVEGPVLTFHARKESRRINVEPGTSAFDVVDIDLDGTRDLITITGDRVVAYPLHPDGAAVEPRILAEVETLLSGSAPQPFPYVLAIEYEGAPALALPTSSALQVRDADGQLFAAFPAMPAASNARAGAPLLAWSERPPRMSGQDALELRVNALIERTIELPEGWTPVAPRPPTQGAGHRLGPATDHPSAWAWFPLQPGQAGARRVHFAVSDAGNRDTVIRIEPPRDSESQAARDALGPDRHYPGNLIMPEHGHWPDIDGDGYTDLVLWTAPEPGLSVEALTRMLAGRDWPLRVTVHLFDATNNRYTARPAARIEVRVPLTWFFGAGFEVPLRHVTMADLDGDGRTDLGFSAARSRFQIRLGAGSDGFGPPALDLVADTPFTGIPVLTPGTGQDPALVGIRTDSVLYLIRSAE